MVTHMGNSKFVYLFMRGIQRLISILRNNFLSFLTLITVIFIYHSFWVVGTGTAGFLNHLSNTSTVRVYLESSNSIVAGDIQKSINKINNVVSSKYFSPRDAKAFAIENSPKTASLASFSEEFFPAFIEITPKDQDEDTLDKIVEEANLIKGVDEASYGREYMAKFKTIGRGAWLSLFVLSILFALSAVFIMYNTIKLSLYRFKEEIKLYSLVGSTRPFVFMPYLFASLLMSFTAYFISTIFFNILFIPFNSSILNPAGINIFETPSFSYYIVTCLFLCIISGLSAVTSVVTFLKQVSSINEE